MKQVVVICVFLLASCSSHYLKYDKQDNFFKNEEFERQVHIQSPEDTAMTSSQTATVAQTPVVIVPPQVTKKSKVARKKSPSGKKLQVVELKTKNREPDIEDTVGFAEGSRRPVTDPFHVGEEVIHSVSYFSAEAGRLSMRVLPYAQVNNRKTYHFAIGLKSTSIFSSFYSVDDLVETYLDYENLIPSVLKIDIKESNKLVQSQCFFDHQILKANFWEKKYTEKDGEEERKFSWDILPFSQNAFSGIFYMRIFTWKVGKEISFRVAEDEKNIVFTGTAVAEEKLETDAGTFDAFKIKASIVSRGALTQTGDIYMWVSNDEHKYILRIEAKIKIGTLVSEVVEIKPGQ